MNNLESVFESLFNGDKDGFIKGIRNVKKEIEKAKEAAIFDSISYPFGNFAIMTCPNPFDRTHSTTITLERKNKMLIEPVDVQVYQTREESEIGHKEWRKLIIETPPLVLKDAITGKITQVPIN